MLTYGHCIHLTYLFCFVQYVENVRVIYLHQSLFLQSKQVDDTIIILLVRHLRWP